MNFNLRLKIIIFFKKVKTIRFILILKLRFFRIFKLLKKSIERIAYNDNLNIEIKKVGNIIIIIFKDIPNLNIIWNKVIIKNSK